MSRSTSVFISHGAPTIAIEDVPARHFLNTFGETLGRPRAIVLISGHWETTEPTLASSAKPPTIHDFFGFPEALFALDYPAPGDPALAAAIAASLTDAGFSAALDDARGLDHGAWMPLMMMYPAADVPVVQLSICPHRDAAWHYRLGAALASLADDNVLVIGSGAVTHNLGEFRKHRGDFNTMGTPGYVTAFSEWLDGAVSNADTTALTGWREHAPEATRAHPSPDHFLPFHVALGAAGPGWSGRRVHDSTMYGVISMDAYEFRRAAA